VRLVNIFQFFGQNRTIITDTLHGDLHAFLRSEVTECRNLQATFEA
jgi:hypothetical protein